MGVEIPQSVRARKRYVRKQPRDGYPDLGRGGMQYGLGIADIGPPAREDRGHANGDVRRQWRQFSVISEARIERLGGLSDEHGERVTRGRDRLLVGRQL